MGEIAAKTMEHIENETEFDADLIWKDLIKRRDINQLKTILHLNYICRSSKDKVAHLDDKSAVLVFSDDFNKCEVHERFIELGKYMPVFLLMMKA